MADAVDRLFQLPLSEFTGARNALAAELRKSGRSDEAAAVKALAKPPISAWAVNQLFWTERKTFERLMTAGETLRKAQAAQLAGQQADVRDALEARRAALSDLVRHATAKLGEASHAAGPDVMRRITTTLEALSTYGRISGAPSPGRLTADVDPPGFDTLASLLPASGGARAANREPIVLPFKQKATATARTAGRDRSSEEARAAQRTAALAAVKDAERELRHSRAAAARADDALQKATARAEAAEAARRDAERQLEQATAVAHTAKAAVRERASESETAAEAVRDAERALDKAKREVPS